MTTYTRFQTEEELMRAIARNARQLGYLVFHDGVAQGSAKGFPDVLIVGHKIAMAIECKGPRGYVRDEQQQWLDEMNRAGIPARIAWSTNDDDFDAIMRDLEEAYERDFHATQSSPDDPAQ